MSKSGGRSDRRPKTSWQEHPESLATPRREQSLPTPPSVEIPTPEPFERPPLAPNWSDDWQFQKGYVTENKQESWNDVFLFTQLVDQLHQLKKQDRTSAPGGVINRQGSIENNPPAGWLDNYPLSQRPNQERTELPQTSESLTEIGKLLSSRIDTSTSEVPDNLKQILDRTSKKSPRPYQTLEELNNELKLWLRNNQEISPNTKTLPASSKSQLNLSSFCIPQIITLIAAIAIGYWMGATSNTLLYVLGIIGGFIGASTLVFEGRKKSSNPYLSSSYVVAGFLLVYEVVIFAGKLTSIVVKKSI